MSDSQAIDPQILATDHPPVASSGGVTPQRAWSLSSQRAATSPPPPPTATRSASSPLPCDDEELHIDMGGLGYAISWLSINSLHALCGTYFVAAGMVYWGIPATRLVWHLDLYDVTLNWRKFHAIAIVHYVFAALHFGALVLFVAQLVYRLTTSEATRASHGARSRDAAHRMAQILPFAKMCRGSGDGTATTTTTNGTSAMESFRQSSRRVLQSFDKGHALLFARNGLFGVESRHFEAVFLCREIVETALQSYQAYRMTHLLPRRVLNRSYIALLILNCWITPLLYRVVKNKAMQRTLCILLDIFLDFVSAIGIPTFLSLTYLDDYDKTLKTFPSRLWFNDSWRIYIVNESPIMLLGSAMDAASRLLFSISLLLSMDDVKHMIRFQAGDSGSGSSSTRPAPTTTTMTSVATDTAQAKRAARLSQSKLPSKSTSKPATMYTKIATWGHRIIVAYGFAILIVQLHAESKPSPPGCALEVRPWLVKQKACALVSMSCHPNASPRFQQGSADEWQSVFGDLNARSLAMLTVRHCPAVTVTPLIQNFPNLLVLKFYNSTIASWPADAAIGQQYHPKLRFIFAVRTTFAGNSLPLGLLPPPGSFPAKVTQISLPYTNLNALPADLDTRWPKYLTLFLESGQFSSFPPVLKQMDVYMLVMSGNALTSVDADVLMTPGLSVLALRHMDIASLPEVGINTTAMDVGWFYLDNTTLTDLPSWMDQSFFTTRVVQAAGTPICKTILAEVAAKADAINNNGNAAVTPVLDKRPWLTKVDCRSFGLKTTSYYPISVETQADEVW